MFISYSVDHLKSYVNVKKYIATIVDTDFVETFYSPLEYTKEFNHWFNRGFIQCYEKHSPENVLKNFVLLFNYNCNTDPIRKTWSLSSNLDVVQYFLKENPQYSELKNKFEKYKILI